MPRIPSDPAVPDSAAAPPGWWAALVARQRRNELALPMLVLGCAVYILALFTSRAAISLSFIGLVLAAVLNRERGRGWRAYWRNPAALVPAALYGWLVLSGVITDDLREWRHQLFRQLPLVVVPLAVAMAPALPARYRAALAGWWLAVAAVVASATLGAFQLHHAEMSLGISLSKTQGSVTGVGHIYFGVMLAVATMAGLEISVSPVGPRYARAGAALAGLLCAAALHVLAYRTGLLALYSTLAVTGIRWLVAKRQWVIGTLLLLGGLAAPLIAFTAFHSVQARFYQSRYDLRRFQAGGDLNDYSLSQRLAAWQTAATLIRDRWLLGVGAADVPRAMHEQYARRSYGLRPENQMLPHNQYLHSLLGGGVVGCGLLLAMLLLPLGRPPTRTDPAVWHFLVAYGVAMLVDSLLQVQYGFHPFILLYAVLVVGPWQPRLQTGRIVTSNLPPPL